MLSFIFNPRSGRYFNPATGLWVSSRTVRASVDAVVRRAERTALALATDLRAGRLSMSVWHEEMRILLRGLHYAVAAAAAGGLEQLNSSVIDSRVALQLAYLKRFASEVNAGTLDPTSGHFVQRVKMYVGAARGTYYMVIRNVVAGDAGYTEERNVLAPADHCQGCLEATAQGWVPLGTLPEVGDRDCLSNCLCDIEFR